MLHLSCQLTINSTTTPCQWNDSCTPSNPKIQEGLFTPNVSMIFFTPHPHQFETQGRADNPMQNSTAQHHLYTATHLVLSKSRGSQLAWNLKSRTLYYFESQNLARNSEILKSRIPSMKSVYHCITSVYLLITWVHATSVIHVRILIEGVACDSF